MKKIMLATAACLMAVNFSCAQVQKPAASAENKAAVHVVKAVPSVANELVYQTILNAYKGKTVVVDFWATWCGPCLAAMKEIDILKEKYKDRKDLVFVYITGETSPEPAWNSAIPGIAGDHYRLSKDQWNYLCKEQLHIPGIPAYAIIKADGTTSYSNLTTGGYIGNDAFEQEMIKALAQ